MGAILSAIVGGLSTRLLTMVAFWLAAKTVISLLFIVVLPIVINNFIFGFVQEAVTAMVSQTGGVSGTATITGLTAWFFIQLRLDTCFSILFSAISINFGLRMIPFLRIG